VNPVAKMDELLDMSRRMKERLEQLSRRQVPIVERLSKGGEDMKDALGAACEAIRVPYL